MPLQSHAPDGSARAPVFDGIVAYCDGGSRGNPGPAGFGVYIQDSAGRALAELSEYLGVHTNNFAEYSALLAALDFAIVNGHRSLRVISDSELMVKQMKGQYRVNSPELRPLYEEARRRVPKLDRFQIQHVLREKNRHADRLGEPDPGEGPRQGRGSSCQSGGRRTSYAQGGHVPRLRKGRSRACAGWRFARRN